MITQEQFESGKTYAQYRDSIEKNKDTFDEVYQDPNLSPEQLDFLQSLPEMKLAIIGEDWCPDVFNVLPRWAIIAKECKNIELRIFERDSREDIMNHFLTDGTKKRIPVFAFYDKDMNLIFWWSGRSKPAEKWLSEQTGGRSFGELNDEEKEEVGAKFREMYPLKFRDWNFNELLNLLSEKTGVKLPEGATVSVN